MITYTSKDSFLSIPKGLGNFSTGSGGGGEDIGPLSGSVVTLSAETQNIASNVEALSGSVETLTSDLGDLSGATDTIGDAVADLLLDVDALDGRVSGNTDNIAALSAATSGLSVDVETLSGVVEANEVKVYYIDNLTQPEKRGLYNEIKRVAANNKEEDFTPGKYKFYALVDNDAYKGWYEVKLARIETAKICFSAIFQSRNSNVVFQRGLSITDQGAYRNNEYTAQVPLVDVGPLSASTTALTASVATLSATTSGIAVDVEELSATTQDVYDAIFYEDESGETYSQIDDLWSSMEDKQDVLEAGDGIDIDGSTISAKIGKGLWYKGGGEITVRAGSGVTVNVDTGAVDLKIGDGLAFSGDTLVTSGGSSSGPEVYLLNKLSQQELLDLYDLIKSYYDDNTSSFTSAWTEDAYAFYIDLRDYNDQQSYNVADHYEGFFPMTVARCHPSDYGGAVMFTGVEGDREGNGHLINIRFIIASDGTTDVGTWWNSPSSNPEMQYNLRITSGGTIENDQDWSSVSDSNNAGRLVMQYFENTQYGDVYSEGKVKWVNMYPTTYNGETKWYWTWAADIVIGTTLYSGVWGMLQDQWYASSDVPPQTLQWTSGATYQSSTYPPVTP